MALTQAVRRTGASRWCCSELPGFVPCCVDATLLSAASSSQTALAQDGRSVTLESGLWRVTPQLWLDGREVLGAIDTAGALVTAEILRDARAPGAVRSKQISTANTSRLCARALNSRWNA